MSTLSRLLPCLTSLLLLAVSVSAQVAPEEAGPAFEQGTTVKGAASAKTTQLMSGVIIDLQTGQALEGATVYAPDLGVGSVSDSTGRYTIELPAQGEVQLRVRYVGYRSVQRSVDVERMGAFDIALNADEDNNLAEVVVAVRKYGNDVDAPGQSEALDIRDVKFIPALLGEVDIISAIKLRPGVSSGSESNHGLYVRGGSSDQNLVMLDGAKLYNPYHLFGFFSTFNPDAVSGLRLYKGAFPAKHGGRLASVIDVGARAGEMDGTHTLSAGLGLLSSRLGASGTLIKDKASYSIHGRRTYVDLLLDPIDKLLDGNVPDETEELPRYNFHDLNARFDFKLSERDELTVSGYYGQDQLELQSFFLDLQLGWSNQVGAATWRHRFSDETYLSTSATISSYDYRINNITAGYELDVTSGILDGGVRTDLTHRIGSKHKLGAGATLSYARFNIAEVELADELNGASFSGGQVLGGFESALYIDDEISVSPKLTIVPGLRLSSYFNEDVLYVTPEPRLRVSYVPSRKLQLQASYSRMAQYFHLTSPAGLALPIDIWYPSTPNTKPQLGHQVSGGVSMRALPTVSLALQSFYKRSTNQVEFVDGANPFISSDIEREFDYGRGYAYGFEAKVERDQGRVQGWVGYTWQTIKRGDFPNIMQGRYFSPRYDRRHDVSAVLTYEITPRLRASTSWVYGSGDLAWLPVGRFSVSDVPGSDFKGLVPVYGDRNNVRLAPYHRIDFSLLYKLNLKWAESDLTFAVYNAYDRRNPFFVYLRPQTTNQTLGGTSRNITVKVFPKQVSLFPVLPSITWNVQLKLKDGSVVVPNDATFTSR